MINSSTMRRHPIFLGVCILFMATCASLHANSIFTFTDTDGTLFSVSETLITTDNGNGALSVISGDGFFDTDPIVLIAGSGTSPAGLFIYNNLLYPRENPLLDVDGLLFRDTVTGAELNIWGERGVSAIFLFDLYRFGWGLSSPRQPLGICAP